MENLSIEYFYIIGNYLDRFSINSLTNTHSNIHNYKLKLFYDRFYIDISIIFMEIIYKNLKYIDCRYICELYLLLKKIKIIHNQLIDNLPNSLESIKFGYNFNQSVDKLPNLLKSIIFGEYFNQSVDKLPN